MKITKHNNVTPSRLWGRVFPWSFLITHISFTGVIFSLRRNNNNCLFILGMCQCFCHAWRSVIARYIVTVFTCMYEASLAWDPRGSAFLWRHNRAPWGGGGALPVPEDRRRQPCLPHHTCCTGPCHSCRS